MGRLDRDLGAGRSSSSTGGGSGSGSGTGCVVNAGLRVYDETPVLLRGSCTHAHVLCHSRTKLC